MGFEEEPGPATTEFTMDMFHVANCCRVCLGIECSLVETISLDHDSIKLSDKLMACVAEVMWLKEGLPSLICSNCIERLRVAYDFRKVCLQSDQTFMRYISQVKAENKSDESQVGSTDPLKVEDKFEYMSTQVVMEALPSIKEEPPSSPEIHFVAIENCIEKTECFIETGESRNCTPEPERCINYINQEQLGKPELEEVTQMIQLDQEHQLIHLQNEAPLEHELQVQQQPSQQKHMTNPTTGVQERSPSPGNVKRVKSFSCTVCDYRCLKSGDLNRHIRMHTGEKPYSCDTCGKKFTTSRNLKYHIRTHTGERPYPCTDCDRRFSLAGALKKHIRTHTGEKPYSCDTCGKKFITSTNLKYHISTHTREKQISCTVYDRGCLTSANLKKNIRTDEKPYSCDTCEKRFISTSNLKDHIRTHTGEKPYLCTACDRSFSVASALKKHIRTHTGEKPYSCDTCGNKFTTSSNLKDHIKRTHISIKPYACTVCDRRFSLAKALKKHVRTHTGEKPYTCDICGKKFALSESLRKHIRNVHH